MGLGGLAKSLENLPRHWLARHRSRRPARYERDKAVVSFSFDDFPVSAYRRGAEVLSAHGIKATYYVSLGLMGRESNVGLIADRDTLAKIMATGNEIGCHTFHHADAWAVSAEHFEESIEWNAKCLDRLFPGNRFQTFAYPHGSATPAAKRIAERRFLGSRGIYWGINRGIVDRSLLASCALFLTEKGSPRYDRVLRTIDRAASSNGWLILYTHDLCDQPSTFGCNPEVFASVVEYVARKGLETAPVGLVARDYLVDSREELLGAHG